MSFQTNSKARFDELSARSMRKRAAHDFVSSSSLTGDSSNKIKVGQGMKEVEEEVRLQCRPLSARSCVYLFNLRVNTADTVVDLCILRSSHE